MKKKFITEVIDELDTGILLGTMLDIFALTKNNAVSIIVMILGQVTILICAHKRYDKEYGSTKVSIIATLYFIALLIISVLGGLLCQIINL